MEFVGILTEGSAGCRSECPNTQKEETAFRTWFEFCQRQTILFAPEMAKNSPSETRTSRMAYCPKPLLPSSANSRNRFQSTPCPFFRCKPANGGLVREFSPLETMCPSVRSIERAMRERRMDPQSTAFPAQLCPP